MGDIAMESTGSKGPEFDKWSLDGYIFHDMFQIDMFQIQTLQMGPVVQLESDFETQKFEFSDLDLVYI